MESLSKKILASVCDLEGEIYINNLNTGAKVRMLLRLIL